MGAAWTAGAVLPGGEIPDADFQAWFTKFRGGAAWLPPEVALGYARRYGSRAEELLCDAQSLPDLGRHFGAGLYEREARFLIDEEWATTAEDILARRTKHGLHMTQAERETFAAWIAEVAR
jgi:glycerol-3-phosphate dehydrogenase